MGVIIRQGIKHSLIRYLGIGVGFFSTVFIYPLALAEVGLLRYIQNTAQLVHVFCLLGAHILAVRFFPVFRDEKNGHNGFLPLLLTWITIGFLVFLVFYLFFRETFLGFFSEQPPETVAYLDYVPAFAFAMLYAQLFTSYTSNFHRIAIPTVFNDLLLKIAFPLLVLAFFAQSLSLSGMVNGMLGAYFLALAGLVAYLASLKELRLRPRWGFLTRARMRELRSFALFNILGTWGIMIANRLDILMLGLLLPPDKAFIGVGIYSIHYFISEVIDTPQKAIQNIASPVVADAWANGDQDKIRDLYKKSALNQFLFGLLIFLLIWTSLADLFKVMPNGELVQQGKWVVLFLGVGKLFDMATGINNLIILHSPFYRFNLYVLAFLSACNILLNYLMIPVWEIEGAALATMVSLILFNLVKFVFLYRKLGMHPFTWRLPGVLAIGLAAWGTGTLVPSLGESLLAVAGSVLIRSALVGGIFLLGVLYFRISPEFQGVVLQAWGRIRRYLKW